MLSDQQIGHFQAFGFVVLRGLLAPARTAALRAEVDTALRDAYAATYHERVSGGISGHYLPMASRLTPVSAWLVWDDPLLSTAAEELLGGPVIPACPEGILYFGEAGWHYDDGIGVQGVTFTVYLDPLTAASGALRFLPCSQHPPISGRLRQYRNARCRDGDGGTASYPGCAAATRPGDVIAFDFHVWHASFGGGDRLAWRIGYQQVPRNDMERERALRWMADNFDQESRQFDHDRYPVWRDWAANSAGHPRRAAMISRLAETGVLALPGAVTGAATGVTPPHRDSR